MNTKKVLTKFNESIKELLDISSDEFKRLLDETSNDIGSILSEGGFLEPLNKNIDKKNILESFPDIGISTEPLLSSSFFVENQKITGNKKIFISYNYPEDILEKSNEINHIIIDSDFSINDIDQDTSEKFSTNNEGLEWMIKAA